jgi:uncharacterized protein involved in exopolysaccharide biosynthesis
MDVVRQHQAKVDELRERISGTELVEGDALKALQARRIEAHAERARVLSLYKFLTSQSRADLKRSIHTASPDPQLSELMQQQATAEQKLADLTEDRAPEHPDIRRTTRVLAQINQQIENRIDGIIAGMKARVELEEAQVNELEKALDRAKKEYRRATQQSRPYEEALQALRTQQDVLERLRLRLIQEQVDQAIAGATSK